MVTTSLLESLSRLSSPLLTAYVRTSPEEASLQGAAPRYLHSLKEEGRSVGESLASEEREPFSKQYERVMEFLSQKKSHGSLVIFAGPSVWEVVSLQVAVRNELLWGKPSLAQLVWLAGEHKQYGIVAVDHKGARFFRFSLGEIVEGEEKKFVVDISGWKQKDLGKVMGEGVAKTHGTQRDVFDKRLDNQYVRLCHETAQQAATFFGSNDIAALFLVGPGKLITAIESKCPRTSRLPIVRIDQDLARVSPPELLKHLGPHIEAWEQQRQSELVTAVTEGERGTIGGFDESLAQLQKGKVRALVLAWDFDSILHRCISCGWVDRSADGVCPVCGAQRRDVNLREVLPELLLKHAVELEIVNNKTGERLKQLGGMAAWIRQKKATARAASSR